LSTLVTSTFTRLIYNKKGQLVKCLTKYVNVTYLIVLHPNFYLKLVRHDEFISLNRVEVSLLLVLISHLLLVLLLLLHFYLLLHLHLLVLVHLSHHLLLLLHLHHLLLIHHLLSTIHVLLLLNSFLAAHVLSWFLDRLLLCFRLLISCSFSCNWLVLIAHIF